MPSCWVAGWLSEPSDQRPQGMRDHSARLAPGWDIEASGGWTNDHAHRAVSQARIPTCSSETKSGPRSAPPRQRRGWPTSSRAAR